MSENGPAKFGEAGRVIVTDDTAGVGAECAHEPGTHTSKSKLNARVCRTILILRGHLPDLVRK